MLKKKTSMPVFFSESTDTPWQLFQKISRVPCRNQLLALGQSIWQPVTIFSLCTAFDGKLVGGFNPFRKILVKMGNLPQIGVKINIFWNHHLGKLFEATNCCGGNLPQGNWWEIMGQLSSVLRPASASPCKYLPRITWITTLAWRCTRLDDSGQFKQKTLQTRDEKPS